MDVTKWYIESVITKNGAAVKKLFNQDN